jgi:hypothetical protein
MKLTLPSRFLALLSLLFATVLYAGSTNLLPGITYNDGPEKLTGKLVFLVQHDYTIETNWEKAASIYEFDLQKKELRKVTDSPFGQTSVSSDGNTYCVNYWLGNRVYGKELLAFVFLEPSGQTRTLNLDRPSNDTEFVGGHVFFEEGEVFQNQIFDYDIAQNKTSLVELPDASKWSKGADFDGIHIPSAQTNVLHFSYNLRSYAAKKIKEGKDYADGVYSLDITSGNIKWISNDYICGDDECYRPKAFDGHYIFFEGPDAPFEGFKLVSSPWECLDTKDHSSVEQAKSVKVLHNFSMLGAFVKGIAGYHFKQMSPDHRYVLVEIAVPLNRRKFSEELGSTKTYYLVDVSTGKTRVLLEDKTEAATKSSLWNGDVHWVQATK